MVHNWVYHVNDPLHSFTNNDDNHDNILWWLKVETYAYAHVFKFLEPAKLSWKCHGTPPECDGNTLDLPTHIPFAWLQGPHRIIGGFGLQSSP